MQYMPEMGTTTMATGCALSSPKVVGVVSGGREVGLVGDEGEEDLLPGGVSIE